MGYLKNFGINYQSLTELSEAELIALVNKMSRNDLIEWLSWNDPNGIYHDEPSLKELGGIMSLEEGQEILLRQVRESRVLA
ncbi:hypothetical protein [Mucilaginibacter sp. OK283]|jgi:hypothetical protein|uniref:hypothetical protein n=1 Tax=Mucilaginibacter sp. OK283 TaxID=1881049 RepID=UPI0008D13B4A|nr:hypothetical protein [Mucilaginibacter sp. OK283]SEP36749.1 hypothetical protein SAMN05428947_112173 [Mucilaginibacter sp. OK283]